MYRFDIEFWLILNVNIMYKYVHEVIILYKQQKSDFLLNNHIHWACWQGTSIWTLTISYDTGDSIIAQQHHLKQHQLIEFTQSPTCPFLPLVAWTMTWKLISLLTCSSVLYQMHFIFLPSETIKQLGLFANWWQSGRSIHLRDPSICWYGAMDKDSSLN